MSEEKRKTFGGCRILLPPDGPCQTIELWPGQCIVDTSNWVEKSILEPSGVWSKPPEHPNKAE